MREKGFEYFDHEADIGIIGYGTSLNEAFGEGAKAMFQIMANIKNVEPKKEIKIDIEASDEEALFVEWLNSLLAYKDIEDIIFSDFKAGIKHLPDKYILNGIAKGEKINYNKHHLKIEVKAATYSQLKIEKINKIYRVQCVVDV